MSNIRREARRRNKNREYSKGKIKELESNSKNKNIRNLYRAYMNLRRVINLELI
jgi:hypothetical protein